MYQVIFNSGFIGFLIWLLLLADALRIYTATRTGKAAKSAISVQGVIFESKVNLQNSVVNLSVEHSNLEKIIDEFRDNI